MNSATSITRYRLDMQYKGTNYCGWQIQPNGLTVQQVLQEKLSQLCNQSVEVVGCGRTDSGVHASYFVAHFDFQGNVPVDLPYRINKMLPVDIAVFSCNPVDSGFHARFDATKRTYQYHIHFQKNVFKESTSWWNPMLVELDIELTNRAASSMVGIHPFSAFCKGEIPNNNPLCEVFSSQWLKTEEGLMFEISANRFLRNMVRATVGTLIDVGTKKISMQAFESLLHGGQRSDAGNSVPACGLFLTGINY
jgi:tRNA pseudouridine38-40 synthase